VGGEALVVSQFTVYGDARKGRRPNFGQAAPPEIAEPLIERLIVFLQEQGLRVETGVFGAMMMVETHNDGPVTIIIEK
jgi:D-tyrosyl-tRNA(Tyr) deacylase